MTLLGGTKIRITRDKKKEENVPRLEINDEILVYWSIANNETQHKYFDTYQLNKYEELSLSMN